MASKVCPSNEAAPSPLDCQIVPLGFGRISHLHFPWQKTPSPFRGKGNSDLTLSPLSPPWELHKSVLIKQAADFDRKRLMLSLLFFFPPV